MLGMDQIEGDQKVSLHLTVTVQSSRAHRLFDHPVQVKVLGSVVCRANHYKIAVNLTQLLP